MSLPWLCPPHSQHPQRTLNCSPAPQAFPAFHSRSASPTTAALRQAARRVPAYGMAPAVALAQMSPCDHVSAEWPAALPLRLILLCKLPSKALPRPRAWCLLFAALQLLLHNLPRGLVTPPASLCPLAFSDCSSSSGERSPLRITQPQLCKEGRGGSHYASVGAAGRHPGECHPSFGSLALPRWKWSPHPDWAAPAPHASLGASWLFSKPGMQRVINKCGPDPKGPLSMAQPS